MRLKGLDLNLLIVLDALLKERSVSLAAISLKLGQSAVSSALARLREHFGDELLMPLNRQMVPTRLALDLQGSVVEFLRGLDAIVHAQPEFVPRETRREFVMLCSDYIAETFVPRVVQRLAEHAPDATLAVRPLSAAASSVSDDFAKRGAHFSIMPTEYCTALHPRAELFHERFVAVVWRDNPTIDETLTLDDLRDRPQITMQFSDAVPDGIDARQLAMAGIARRNRVVVDQFALALELIVGTPYLALVPRRLAEQWSQTEAVRVLELPDAVGRIEFNEALQWSESHIEDPALEWFRDLVIDTARMH